MKADNEHGSGGIIMSNDKEKIDILNREEFIKHVVTVVNKIAANKGHMTFAVNGEWGCGKTFVLHKIQEQLESNENKKFLVIPYNCWQYDYYDEPLVAIVSSLLDFNDSKKIISENTKKELKEIILNVSLGIATSVAKQFGIDFSDIQEGMLEARDKTKNTPDFDEYYNFKKSLDDLQKALENISENCTIVFAVDELDRCLPEYAIKVLERLHHIADGVSNMITIIAFDKERLKNTIGSIFGLENVDNYLKKFIKFEMYLDNGKQNSSKFSEKFSDFYARFDHDLWELDKNIEKQFIEELFRGVDIRLQEEVVEEATIFHDICFKNEEKKPDYTVMYMELFIVTMYRAYNLQFPNIPQKFKDLFGQSLDDMDSKKHHNIFDIISMFQFCFEKYNGAFNDCNFYNNRFSNNLNKLYEFKKILPFNHTEHIRIQKQNLLPDLTQQLQQRAVRKCVKCGASLLGDSLYCHSCGKERKKCSCGEFIDAWMNFCPKCGKILDKTERRKQQEEQKQQEEINKLAIECGFRNLPYNFIDKGDYLEVVPPMENEDKNIHIHMIEKECFSELKNWDEAMQYAKNLRKGGFKDWRVPTIEELKIICKFISYCEIDQKNYFWSSSTSSNPYVAYFVQFNDGYADGINKAAKCAVRYVR